MPRIDLICAVFKRILLMVIPNTKVTCNSNSWMISGSGPLRQLLGQKNEWSKSPCLLGSSCLTRWSSSSLGSWLQLILYIWERSPQQTALETYTSSNLEAKLWGTVPALAWRGSIWRMLSSCLSPPCHVSSSLPCVWRSCLNIFHSPQNSNLSWGPGRSWHAKSEGSISGTQGLKSQGLSGDLSATTGCPALRKSPSFWQENGGNNTHQRTWRINSYKSN